MRRQQTIRLPIRLTRKAGNTALNNRAAINNHRPGKPSRRIINNPAISNKTINNPAINKVINKVINKTINKVISNSRRRGRAAFT